MTASKRSSSALALSGQQVPATATGDGRSSPPEVNWLLVMEGDDPTAWLTKPPDDDTVWVCAYEEDLTLAGISALVADTPACRSFYDSVSSAMNPAVFPFGNRKSSTERAHRIMRNHFELTEAAELVVRAMELFADSVPRIFVAIVCGGVIGSRRALEEVTRRIGLADESWVGMLEGACITVEEISDRCPKLESIIQKIQYRREDVADRREELEDRAAAMRDSKGAKLAARDEWIVDRYRGERSKHQADEFGNVPAMEAVVGQWNRAGIGRAIANVKTVRRILKARGIDPQAPNATP